MAEADAVAWYEALPEELKQGDGSQPARQLVKIGRLTAYQANCVFHGRFANLSLGDYLLLDKLGEGGMGAVFKALHRRMERVVALKVLPTSATRTPAAVERFHREVKAAARLLHPNIVAAFDAGQARATHYLVMEHVAGSDLSKLVRAGGPRAVADAVDHLRQAAKGLEYAHQRGVVHRDVKPSNLLLSNDGVVKVLDMGLARLDAGSVIAGQPLEDRAEPADQLTGTNAVMGTVDYMAPEQAENTRAADARADVYSLGCTLWYLLTGRAMFPGDSVVQKLMAHRDQPAPILRSHRADVPDGLEAVYAKMVAKKAEDRFQTMAEVGAALDAVAAELADRTEGRTTSFAVGSGVMVGDNPPAPPNVPVDTAAWLAELADKPIRAPWMPDSAKKPSGSPETIQQSSRPDAATSVTPKPYLPAPLRGLPPKTLAAVAAAAVLTVGLAAAGVVITLRRPDGTVQKIEAPAGTTVEVAPKPIAKPPAGEKTVAAAAVDWPPGEPAAALPGLLPAPTEFPGMGRWQLITKQPSSP
ncbi:MAG: serine/threonine protein kinase, partial [Planctomycetia bacterium]